MGRLGKGLTNSLALRTKRPNKKQKSGFAITGITNQYFRKLRKGFKNSLYLVCKKKQVHIEPTEAHFFLIRQETNIIKGNNIVRLRTKGVKSDADGPT